MKKGFTLIEILIVISLIGVLIVFLVPRISGVRDLTREAAVKSVMHSVQLSVEAYLAENNTYPIVTSAISLNKLYDQYLKVGGYLSSLPKNPFTNKAYADGDKAGKITYSYDATSDTYTITGYKRNGTTKILDLSNL